MARNLKLPQISDKTQLLSFDIESNGLHGQAFAVGAVLVDAKGKILDKFSGRIKISEALDPWVEQNVLPVIEDMPINYHSYNQLKEAFWDWYKTNEPKSDYVIVNNGYPVEYRFLLECQDTDIEERYWQHPFPILDLISLLIQVGERPTTDKNQRKHHPVDDALAAANTAFNAFRQSGILK